MEGEMLAAAEASDLAKMPGRRELHQQVVRLSLSPGARLAGALTGPAGVIAGCLRAIIDKAEAA